MEWNRAKELHGSGRVFHGVQRLDRRIVRMLAVHELRVALGDVAGVAEHGVTKVDGRRRRVNRAVETVLDQQRNPAGVIDVGV